MENEEIHNPCQICGDESSGACLRCSGDTCAECLEYHEQGGEICYACKEAERREDQTKEFMKQHGLGPEDFESDHTYPPAQ